jgi:hypothetical protein
LNFGRFCAFSAGLAAGEPLRCDGGGKLLVDGWPRLPMWADPIKKSAGVGTFVFCSVAHVAQRLADNCGQKIKGISNRYIDHLAFLLSLTYYGYAKIEYARRRKNATSPTWWRSALFYTRITPVWCAQNVLKMC